MPTGGGKSRTFQLPALTEDGVTVVIMPLRSLIHDQELNMMSLGVSCGVLLGSQSMDETRDIREEFL